MAIVCLSIYVLTICNDVLFVCYADVFLLVYRLHCPVCQYDPVFPGLGLDSFSFSRLEAVSSLLHLLLIPVAASRGGRDSGMGAFEPRIGAGS
jgi:hypothetical protein